MVCMVCLLTPVICRSSQGATMLLDSAFGDLWMPMAVFVMLGVTFGIGLSRLLRCRTLLHAL